MIAEDVEKQRVSVEDAARLIYEKASKYVGLGHLANWCWCTEQRWVGIIMLQPLQPASVFRSGLSMKEFVGRLFNGVAHIFFYTSSFLPQLMEVILLIRFPFTNLKFDLLQFPLKFCKPCLALLTSIKPDCPLQRTLSSINKQMND